MYCLFVVSLFLHFSHYFSSLGGKNWISLFLHFSHYFNSLGGKNWISLFLLTMGWQGCKYNVIIIIMIIDTCTIEILNIIINNCMI